MSIYEVLPTDEVLYESICEDKFDRNKNILKIYEALTSDFVPNTIAIDGSWGSGKTFFIKELILFLNAMNTQYKNMEDVHRQNIVESVMKQNRSDDRIFTIYYDAWKNDDDNDPITSIIYEIVYQLGVNFKTNDKKIDFIKLGAAVIKIVTKVDILQIMNAAFGEEKETDEDEYSLLLKQRDYEKKIQEFLSSILEDPGARLVICIDELDRCNPNFAIKLLEQIKHYLNDDRITFIFSINMLQLQHTIRQHYGDDFDASRYLIRFFDLQMSLSEIDKDRFFDELTGNQDSIITDVSKKMIRVFNMEIRDEYRFYYQLQIATKGRLEEVEARSDNDMGRMFILKVIVPILIGLKLSDSTRYYAFINGEDSSPLKDVLLEDFDELLLDMIDAETESFEEQAGMQQLTKEDAIERVYQAIFSVNYEEGYSLNLGYYEFSGDSRKLAVESASLMSSTANFNLK